MFLPCILIFIQSEIKNHTSSPCSEFEQGQFFMIKRLRERHCLAENASRRHTNPSPKNKFYLQVLSKSFLAFDKTFLLLTKDFQLKSRIY